MVAITGTIIWLPYFQIESLQFLIEDILLITFMGTLSLSEFHWLYKHDSIARHH